MKLEQLVIALRMVLPQTLPRLLDALRLELERELGYRNDLSMDHVLGCERLLRFLATDGSPAP